LSRNHKGVVLKLAQGFKAMKVKIGFGAEYDVEVVKVVREAVGSDIDLMVDANHAYDVSATILGQDARLQTIRS